MIAEKYDVLDWYLSNSPRVWIKVADLTKACNLTRREIRQLASERGYACGNEGIAKLDRLSHEEQEHAYNRIKSQAMSMLVRCRKMRETIQSNTGMQLELPI